MIRDILFLLALFVVIRLALDKTVLTTNARKSMQQLCNFSIFINIQYKEKVKSTYTH